MTVILYFYWLLKDLYLTDFEKGGRLSSTCMYFLFVQRNLVPGSPILIIIFRLKEESFPVDWYRFPLDNLSESYENTKIN